MIREDLIKCYAYAELLWNTFKPELGDEKSKLQDELWFSFLQRYDLDIIFASMRDYATESDFCNIAKIASNCQKISNLLLNEITAEEIWNDFIKTIFTAQGCLGQWTMPQPYGEEFSPREKYIKLYDNLPDCIKSFLGGREVFRKFCDLDEKSLSIERTRFLNSFYNKRREENIKLQLQGIINNKPFGLEFSEEQGLLINDEKELEVENDND